MKREFFILTLSILTAFMYCPEKALEGSQSTAACRRPETSMVCASLMRRALTQYFFSGCALRSAPLLNFFVHLFNPTLSNQPHATLDSCKRSIICPIISNFKTQFICISIGDVYDPLIGPANTIRTPFRSGHGKAKSLPPPSRKVVCFNR
jgi:hypothetical protein